MKRKFKICIAVTLCLAILAITGCTKRSISPNVAFVGRYYGNGTDEAFNAIHPYTNAVKVFASGVNPNQITMIDSPNGQSLTGIIKGDSVTIISGVAKPNCFCILVSVTGQGSLKDNVLAYKIYCTYNLTTYVEFDTVTFNGARN